MALFPDDVHRRAMVAFDIGWMFEGDFCLLCRRTVAFADSSQVEHTEEFHEKDYAAICNYARGGNIHSRMGSELMTRCDYIKRALGIGSKTSAFSAFRDLCKQVPRFELKHQFGRLYLLGSFEVPAVLLGRASQLTLYSHWYRIGTDFVRRAAVHRRSHLLPEDCFMLALTEMVDSHISCILENCFSQLLRRSGTGFSQGDGPFPQERMCKVELPTPSLLPASRDLNIGLMLLALVFLDYCVEEILTLTQDQKDDLVRNGDMVWG